MRLLTLFLSGAIAASLGAPARAAMATEAESLAGSSVTVVVTDPSGLRVPGATVTLAPKSGEPQVATSDSSGEALLDGLLAGEYSVRVELPGFRPFVKQVKAGARPQKVDARLELAAIEEALSVAPEEKGLASLGSTNVLTAEQIAQLPDDPDELEAALRAIGGPGAMLRVNGFSGGRLPPKSQISQIRFQMNPLSAEFHDVSFTHIDIQTKPGLGEWRTNLRSAFRNDALNARSPLADARVPDSQERLTFELSGPLRKNKTTFSLNAEGRAIDTFRTGRSNTSLGFTPSLVATATDRFDVSARIENAWGKTHTARAEFQSLANDQTGLGVSGFDLPERAYAQDQRETVFRFSDNGVLRGRLVGETKVQALWRTLSWTPATSGPTTRVMGAFAKGGAQVEGSRETRELTWESNFDWSKGKHALRGGWLVRSLDVESDERRNALGTFTYASLADLAARKPFLFSQRLGDPRVSYTHTEAGVYIQDEVKLSSKLSVGLGVRNEFQSNAGSSLNLAPRLGLTYALNGKTNMKLGGGRFVDWFSSETYEQTLRLDGERQKDLTLTTPTLDPSGAITSSGPALATRLAYSDDLVLPRVWRVGGGIERSLSSSLRLMADYAHVRGSGQLRSRNRGLVRTAGGDFLRELEIESTGESRRDQVDVRLMRMMNQNTRIGFFLGYTWSRSSNHADSALSLPVDEGDPAAEWGPAAGDVRHRVFGMANWRGARGFTAGAMFQAFSGAPYEVLSGRDDNGDGFVTDRARGFTRNAGRAPARINLDMRVGWGRSFGPERRPSGPQVRVIRGGDEGVPDIPGAGANRKFRLSIYAQIFNALNRTNPLGIGNVYGSPLFGQAIAAEPGRRVELGAGLSF